jgi:hypothetical protein
MFPVIPIDDIKEITRLICITALGITFLKLMMLFVSEIFPKNCRHCGKKASGT